MLFYLTIPVIIKGRSQCQVGIEKDNLGSNGFRLSTKSEYLESKFSSTGCHWYRGIGAAGLLHPGLIVYYSREIEKDVMW